MEIRGISPEAPQPEEPSHPAAAINGPPLMLPTEPQEPLERPSLADTKALRSEIAELAPHGSALEAVCKDLPDVPASVCRGAAAASSGNLTFLSNVGTIVKE